MILCPRSRRIAEFWPWIRNSAAAVVDSGGLRGGELCPFLPLQEKKKKDDDDGVLRFAVVLKNSGSGRRLGVWVQIRWPGVPNCGVTGEKRGACEILGAFSFQNVD